MKLIKKIAAKTSNIVIDRGELYFRDVDNRMVRLNLENNNIIWNEKIEIFRFGLSKDYLYIYWTNDESYDREILFIRKDSLNTFSEIGFRPKVFYKENLIFADWSTYGNPDIFGLYDIERKKTVWKNNQKIPLNVFIKGDYFYTLLEEMRLERVNALTGELMWSISTEVKVRHEFIKPQNIIDVIDGHLVMVYDTKKIVGIDENTGKIAWEWSLEGVIDEISDLEFDSDSEQFIQYEEGKYYNGWGDKLLSMDIINKRIDVVIGGEIDINGVKKEMVFHYLYRCGDKICFYGSQYSKKARAHYSVIGIFDMKKKKVVDFADDEFPGRLYLIPAIYDNRLFQQDDDGNIHIFELEMED